MKDSSLKEFANAIGMTVGDICDTIGCKRQYISVIRQGKHKMRQDNISKKQELLIEKIIANQREEREAIRKKHLMQLELAHNFNQYLEVKKDV